MKTFFVLAFLTSMSFGAQAACTIVSVADARTDNTFNRYGGWDMDIKKFEVLCEKLRKGRARVTMLAMATVLGERSVGWASLSLVDATTGIATTSFASKNVVVDPYASQDRAERQMVKAINNAAESWDIDSAIAELDLERRRMRQPR